MYAFRVSSNLAVLEGVTVISELSEDGLVVKLLDVAVEGLTSRKSRKGLVEWE